MQSVKSLSTVNRILIGASMLSAAGLTVLGFALTPWEGDLTGGDYFPVAGGVSHPGITGRSRPLGALGVRTLIAAFVRLEPFGDRRWDLAR
jgi:hypothetical protein